MVTPGNQNMLMLPTRLYEFTKWPSTQEPVDGGHRPVVFCTSCSQGLENRSCLRTDQKGLGKLICCLPETILTSDGRMY